MKKIVSVLIIVFLLFNISFSAFAFSLDVELERSPSKNFLATDDIKPSYRYAKYVSYVQYNNLMFGTASRLISFRVHGYTSTMGSMYVYNFNPNDCLTREMTCQILFNIYLNYSKRTYLKNSYKEKDYKGYFSDVPYGKWYTQSVEFLCSKGIIRGVDEENFGVNQPIKREDFLLMLYKMVNVLRSERDESSTTYIDSFSNSRSFVDDSEISYYSRDAIDYFTSINSTFYSGKDKSNTVTYPQSLISGYPDGTLRPKNMITRIEAAILITNFCIGILQV